MRQSEKPSKMAFLLSSIDLFQIQDALTSRAEAYEKTAASLDGELPDPENLSELFIPEEVRDADEAREIAEHFRDIIDDLDSQYDRWQRAHPERL